MDHFFGEFLVAEGEIDEVQLAEALDFLADANLPIGQIAIRSGQLSDATVKQICDAQKQQDLPFGRVAEELGFLNHQQVSALLHEQSQTHPYLAEALVQHGCLPNDQLGPLLDRYKSNEANRPGPEEGLPELLRHHPMMIPLLEALPTTALRVARLQLLTAQARDFSGSLPQDRGMYVTVETDPSIRIGITADEKLSTYLTCAMLALAPEDLSDADIDDALGEFINILAGTAKRALEPDGIGFEMSTPEPLTGPDSGFTFDLRTSGGLGALIVDPD